MTDSNKSRKSQKQQIADLEREVTQLTHELKQVQRLLGLSQTSIPEHGDKIALWIRQLEHLTLTIPDFHKLCFLLAETSTIDFRALKECWGVTQTPRQVEELLWLYRKHRGLKAPYSFLVASATLEHISKNQAEMRKSS